jgi:hypothetical protein
VDADPDVRAAYTAWDADPCAPEAANDGVTVSNVYEPYDQLN